MDDRNNRTTASIIILNYFGEKVISETVNSLLNQDYPKNKYEILIPDNASKDNSLKILKELSKKNSNIKVIPLKNNYGFAGGNNRALKHAKGKYIILLNNDCLVDRNWLKNLIECAGQDKQIFSVSSKILIYPKYFQITFKSENSLKECRLNNTNLLRFGKEQHLDIPFNKQGCNYTIDIPFEEKNDKEIQLQLEFIENNVKPIKLIEKLDYKSQRNYEKDNVINLKISTQGSDFKKQSFNKIQNAGSLVFHDGYGRDIGATVQNQKGDYEKDIGQYDYNREVYSTCGAAVLYRRSVVDKIGFLTDDFFMYYEDTELCERAALAGYKNYYCHKAIARHLHALSSKEWSPFFIYHTEKGRLLHVYYHFPINIFLKEYLHFFKYSILRIGHNLIFDRKHLKKDIQYFSVSMYFIKNFLYISTRKKVLNQNNIISINDFYSKIIHGDWIEK